jgi:hypothetical protein
MNRNVGDTIHQGPDETSQSRTWMNSNDYLQNLAISMPVTQDCTILQVNGFLQPEFNQPQMLRNGLSSAALPEWTSQNPDWQQDPRHRRQIDHTVGIPDSPVWTQAPSSPWMENGAVNPTLPIYTEL